MTMHKTFETAFRALATAVTAVAVIATIVGGVVATAQAQVKIDITRGFVEPMPVAISDFYAPDAAAAPFDVDIPGVITADLERSGLFKAIDKRAHIQRPRDMLPLPRFADWRAINAQALVTGRIDVAGDGRLTVEFRLWDVYAQSQMTGFVYRAERENWRRVAHLIADAVYKRITGEDGYFDTRIVYVAESGPADRRVKRLAIMDQDGANHQYLTDGRELVLTPRFSPTAQKITYMSYRNNRPRVYIYDLESGEQQILGDFEGMTFAPRFSPDGRSVVMSLAEGGNTDIYTMSLDSRTVRRLTNHPAIDTSPSFSPEGDRVVFNSDRSGQQELYVADADGGDVRRISFGDGCYATPVWSPRGDLIAFTKMKGGVFYIGVMRPDGSGERLLAQGYLVESPTWAPNGRVLMFYRQERPQSNTQGGEVRLYSVDLTGYNERLVVTPGEASDPAWSPLIR